MSDNTDQTTSRYLKDEKPAMKPAAAIATLRRRQVYLERKMLARRLVGQGSSYCDMEVRAIDAAILALSNLIP